MRRRSIFILLAFAVCHFLDRYFEYDIHCTEAIGWWGALISGVGSLGGSIWGNAAANRRLREANRMIDRKQKRLDAWRDSEFGTNFLDRADSRSALRQVQENIRETQKAADTNAVKRGLTDEAKVAQAARLNRGYADVVSRIAAAGQQHKDRVQQQYMSETSALENMKIQNLLDTTGASNLAGGIAGSAGSLATALAGIGGGGSTPTTDYTKVAKMASNAVGIPSNYQIRL